MYLCGKDVLQSSIAVFCKNSFRFFINGNAVTFYTSSLSSGHFFRKISKVQVTTDS